MIKDLILPKSMLCVVKKYSMNGCEMSSLFLGHLILVNGTLKKTKEKKQTKLENFRKKKE